MTEVAQVGRHGRLYYFTSLYFLNIFFEKKIEKLLQNPLRTKTYTYALQLEWGLCWVVLCAGMMNESE